MGLINGKLTEDQGNWLESLAHIETVVMREIEAAAEERTKEALNRVLEEVRDSIGDLFEYADQQAE